MNSRELTLWITLLSRCDNSVIDLTDADADAQECARQMCAARILVETEPLSFTLDSAGSRLLLLVERLCKYSLGID